MVTIAIIAINVIAVVRRLPDGSKNIWEEDDMKAFEKKEAVLVLKFSSLGGSQCSQMEAAQKGLSRKVPILEGRRAYR